MNKENIQVLMRFRPLNKREKKLPHIKNSIQIDSQNVKIRKEKKTHNYSLDKIYNNVSQEELFNDSISSSIIHVADGYNATIFAYGPTSSGKSFTMFGNENKNNEQRGIIPRACELLFDIIDTNNNVVEATIKCTFIEIYREYIRDLLNKKELNKNYTPSLRIREHTTKGIFVQNCTEKFVESPEQVMEQIELGLKNRVVGSTFLNDVSSRSHAVFSIHVTQILEDNSQVQGKLHLVDLAGSENVGKSKVSGISLLEAQMINKSLSALGNVIFALTEKSSHVPYRDSRLTFLLHDSLGGNSKTTIITTASPHPSVFSETLSTLKFAQRAKQIKNKPVQNKHSTYEQLELRVKHLEKELDKYREEDYNNKNTIEKKENNRIKRLERHIQELSTSNKKFREMYENEKKQLEKQKNIAIQIEKEMFDDRLKLHSYKVHLEDYQKLLVKLKRFVNNPPILQNIIHNADIDITKEPSIDTSHNLGIVSIELN